jgi:hypothetical protein
MILPRNALALALLLLSCACGSAPQSASGGATSPSSSPWSGDPHFIAPPP